MTGWRHAACSTSTRSPGCRSPCSCCGAGASRSRKKTRASALSCDASAPARTGGRSWPQPRARADMAVRGHAPDETLLDPARRHRAAVARSLSWADEAAENGDHADALSWQRTIEAIGDQLTAEYQEPEGRVRPRTPPRCDTRTRTNSPRPSTTRRTTRHLSHPLAGVTSAPLHPSTVEALRTYGDVRDRRWPEANTNRPATGSGGVLSAGCCSVLLMADRERGAERMGDGPGMVW